jgi:GntR family transcriptional regulator, nutrient-sensing system regulator
VSSRDDAAPPARPRARRPIATIRAEPRVILQDDQSTPTMLTTQPPSRATKPVALPRSLPSADSVAAVGANRPKYQELYEALGRRLDLLPSGSPLPTERELCELYGVSRPTVRRALRHLESEQRISRLQGRGTFAARPKIDLALALTSLSEDMLAQGVVPGAKLIDVSRLRSDADIEARLGLEPGGEVLRVERLRLADGDPVAIEVLFVSTARFDGISAGLGLGKSFYRLLHTDYGVELASAEETIEAAAAGRREAELLGIPPASPVLLLSRRTVDTSGRPTEYVRSVYRADRFRLRSLLERPAASRAPLDRAPVMRLATASDVPDIARVFVAAWRSAYPGIVDEHILAALDEAEVGAWIRSLMRSPNQATVVAVSGEGRIIGFTRFGEDPEDTRRGQVFSLYVDPDDARHGVGRGLLLRALDALAEHRTRVVTLWVFEANAGAIAFYRALGFVPDGARRVEPQYGTPEIRLVRDATPLARPAGPQHGPALPSRAR